MVRMPLATLDAEAPTSLIVDRFATPIDGMYAVSDDAGRLRAFAWADHEARGIEQLRQQYGSRVAIANGHLPAAVRTAIDDYFAGDLRAIDRIDCATNGTPFQQQVWNALRRIPTGTTLSYGTLATRIGNASAVRAVGLANGANPIAVVVPCHRVIGTDGSLTGYGGGLARKRWLLAHEGVKGLLGNEPLSLFE
jgi:methylated-DNA-[protein]-cysteine S-methyltransferase